MQFGCGPTSSGALPSRRMSPACQPADRAPMVSQTWRATRQMLPGSRSSADATDWQASWAGFVPFHGLADAETALEDVDLARVLQLPPCEHPEHGSADVGERNVDAAERQRAGFVVTGGWGMCVI
jgi:hypothetical protein